MSEPRATSNRNAGRLQPGIPGDNSPEPRATSPRNSHRGHWAIENSLHWVLDVGFNEDQSRLRNGFGAKNMAVVRHFALNLVRSAKDKKSIKLRRKVAGWTPDYLEQLLSHEAG